jgi:hypothetical protein
MTRGLLATEAQLLQLAVVTLTPVTWFEFGGMTKLPSLSRYTNRRRPLSIVNSNYILLGGFEKPPTTTN